VASDFESLIPTTVAREVIASLGERTSPLMRLCRVVQMPSAEAQIPVISAAPVSGFVDPLGGLKPDAAVEWAAVLLQAGEIGAVVPVPQSFIDDTTLNVTASVQDELAASFARTFETAALYGGGDAPAAWPAGGLTAPANAPAASGATVLEAVDAALSMLEAEGVQPDGILGGAALAAALRKEMVAALAPFTSAPQSLWGIPILTSTFWDDTVGVALVGGFRDVVVGVRQTITYTVSDQGITIDGAGKVLLNALQQDSIIVRAFMRIALQAVKPIGSSGQPVPPLALAKVGATGAAAKSKA
jgi:HK97 family phage major capsid protein